jgi:hypothetical protein
MDVLGAGWDIGSRVLLLAEWSTTWSDLQQYGKYGFDFCLLKNQVYENKNFRRTRLIDA